jgi:hypothetical protein
MTLNLQLEGLILLLLFIAPGFLCFRSYSAVRLRYYKEETIFEQLVTTITASAIIHTLLFPVAGLVVAVSRWLLGYSLDMQALLQPVSTLSIPDVVWYGLGLLGYFACSLILAWYGGPYVARRFTQPESVPLWQTVLVEEPKGQVGSVWLTVRLRNGEEYTGALSNFVWVGDEDNTIELGLEKVTYKPPKATSQAHPSGKGNPSAELDILGEPIELPNQRLLIRSQDILWLSRLEVPEEGALA